MIPSTSTTGGLALFLGLAALAAAAVVWGRFRRVVVPRPRRWGSVGPRIWISAHVRNEDVIESVRWWRSLGHDVDLSSSLQVASVIVVGDPTVDERASAEQDAPTRHGVTHSWSSASGLVTRAEIRVLPYASSLVIAHEIGHALGYEHPLAPPSGHMLHPTRPGWDSRGLVGP